MSSSNRTQYLGLSNWLETDRPKRTDFVLDNNIIDRVVGLHISDNDKHLEENEKARISEPFKISVMIGTGNDTSLRPGFSPSLVIAFKRDAPMFVNMSNYTLVNAAVATKRGSSGGVTISDDLISFTQSSQANDGKYYNFSEAYAEYIVIAFR